MKYMDLLRRAEATLTVRHALNLKSMELVNDDSRIVAHYMPFTSIHVVLDKPTEAFWNRTQRIMYSSMIEWMRDLDAFVQYLMGETP